MKRNIFTTILLLTFTIALRAQNTVTMYPEMSDVLQQVFCDYVSAESETKYISSRHGQYVGQLIDNKIYGWGFYLTDEDAQTYGQFRKGKHIFGITMLDDVARVGAEEHFVEYDLSTGKIVRIHTVEGDVKLQYPYVDDAGQKSPYAFLRIKYSNGDVYYGETLGGRRHGYGVYYWTTGDFWYGKYVDGYRQGYGALFKTDHKVFYGKWIGDRKVE